MIHFLKGNDKEPDGEFIEEFQAVCEIEGDSIKCIRQDFGHKWETVIKIGKFKIDENFL